MWGGYISGEGWQMKIHKRAWGNSGKVYVSFRDDPAGFRGSYIWFLN